MSFTSARISGQTFFCCERKVTVTQCLMRTESGDVQPQRPAAADGVRTESFQFCFGVGRQGIIA